MRIDNSAVSYLTDLLKTDITGTKKLRVVKDGCAWHAKYKIVLDEQRDNDLVYVDNNITIIANKSLDSAMTHMIIQYIMTLLGYSLVLR